MKYSVKKFWRLKIQRTPLQLALLQRTPKPAKKEDFFGLWNHSYPNLVKMLTEILSRITCAHGEQSNLHRRIDKMAETPPWSIDENFVADYRPEAGNSLKSIIYSMWLLQCLVEQQKFTENRKWFFSAVVGEKGQQTHWVLCCLLNLVED